MSPAAHATNCVNCIPCTSRQEPPISRSGKENHEPTAPTPIRIHALRRTVATKPANASPKGSYPDHHKPGTRRTNNRADTHHETTRHRTRVNCPPLRIVRIETVPMTTEELHRAGKALGVLLTNFRNHHPDLFT